MSDWLIVALGVVAGVLLLWVVLIGLLWIQQRRTGSTVDWRAMMRLVPDVIRLVKRLATDPTVPRGTRWWLLALLGYLLMPFDLVPDFIPVLGFADDAVVVAIVLRFAIRHAGIDAIRRHWPGTPDGLASVLTLAGLPSTPPPN
ncbi:YkvA family protein [Microbacterium sp. NPDC056736]|uniref:YkvA family protein n=1 Tax=Microbacterium sp. NPDC056736 TaxID=3345932 RepID=UPI0036723249